MTLEQRFWRKVDRRGPDECWPWTGGKTPCGYGLIRSSGHGHLRQTHRVSWILANGSIPRGMCVLHSCDNPPCCNPAHLWLGTHAENMADRDAKGRGTTTAALARIAAKRAKRAVLRAARKAGA